MLIKVSNSFKQSIYSPTISAIKNAISIEIIFKIVPSVVFFHFASSYPLKAPYAIAAPAILATKPIAPIKIHRKEPIIAPAKLHKNPIR